MGETDEDNGVFADVDTPTDEIGTHVRHHQSLVVF